MALTFESSIDGDILAVDGLPNYCYLYEPFGVVITESDILATKLYIDISIYDTKDLLGTPIETKVKYVDYDFNSTKKLEIDLMEIAQQIHNANLYKIAKLDDITDADQDMVLSRIMYAFKIYSDVTLVSQVIKKIPIIGVREFIDYTPVTAVITTKLTEFEENGIFVSELIKRWTNFKGVQSTIVDIDGSTTDASSTTVQITAPIKDCNIARGGMIFWKSRKGGWMFWGMDLYKKTYMTSQEGSLATGLFRANSQRNPYVPVNYTEVKSTYSIDLKALALTQSELISVAGIASSPVVYFQEADFEAPLELMKLSSSSAPYTNLSNGGDFSVTLTSISSSMQKTY